MIERKLLSIDDVEEGRGYVAEIFVNPIEAIHFLDLTGDLNPLHRDQSFASQTSLGRLNLAGQQITSLCIGLIGTHMPGPGWSCLSVDAKYIKPAYENTTYLVKIECVSKSKAVGVVKWSITVKEKESDICVSRILAVTQRII